MNRLQTTSRREFLQLGGLQIGAISALGLSLPKLLAQEAAQKAAGKQNDKPINCIFMFLQGGASHIDMYDMKPDMSAEIRGEFNPAKTNLPGLHLSDHLPKLGRCADKFSLIRSMQSYTSKHGEGDVHMMSGSPVNKIMQPPSFGAVMSWQKKQFSQVPPFVHLGDLRNAAGRAGYLPRRHDPYLIAPDPTSQETASHLRSELLGPAERSGRSWAARKHARHHGRRIRADAAHQHQQARPRPRSLG